MAKVNLDAIEPNSHARREERLASVGEKSSLDTKKTSDSEKTKLKPVVKKSGVVSTKKPLGKRFASFFTEKDGTDIRNYIIFDWLIPGIKNGILDILSLMFFDEVRDKRSSRRREKERTSYSSYYRGETRRGSSRERERDRYRDDKIDYQNIILERREDAEDVVDALKERIDKNGSATVADLLDLIDEASQFTDNNWGWTHTRDIGIRRVSRGYLIDVARAEYLDD